MWDVKPKMEMEVTSVTDKFKENFFNLLDFVKSKIGNVLPPEDSAIASRLRMDFGADVSEKAAAEMNKAIFRRDLIVKLLSVASTLAVTFFTVKLLRDQMDPTRKEKDKTREKAMEMLRRLGVKDVKLSDYELCIAANLVDPLEMTVSWGNIGGLDDVIEQIQDTVIFPFRRHDLFPSSALIQPPKGVLLYGPPGCGKTMIAKATAKAAGARFINLQVSSLLDKWYGESQKRAEAVFSLAMKLQPAIIFIDEIDSFLRTRTGNDHEATLMIKTQFMSFWDGLITKQNCQIMIMGATNRPQDVDAAILRRMPCAFRIGMPGRIQRISILSLLLEGEEAENDIDYSNLGDLTDGFSGSDLKEACRVAALNRVHEYVSEARRLHGDDYCDRVEGQIRPMSANDLEYGLNKVRSSKQTMTESVCQINLD